MALGILLMDLIWATGLFGLGYLSVFTAFAVAEATPGPAALSLTLALASAPLTWIFACTSILFLLPKPRPGKYRLMRGRDFYAWALGFIAQRWLELPPMGLLHRQSAVLRFFVMRASGAKVAFTSQMSSDAAVLDPALFTMGKGAMLGSKSTVACHFILGDRLVLAPVVIDAGAQVAIDVVIGPGARIGRNAIIEARASIGPEAVVGDEAVIGGAVAMGRAVRVGKRARIPMASVVPATMVIPDDATWPQSAPPADGIATTPPNKDSAA